MAQPVCQYLRTKASYIPALRLETALAEVSPSAHYWCLRTMTVIGPDDTLVSPEECKSHRTCFETSDIVLA